MAKDKHTKLRTLLLKKYSAIPPDMIIAMDNGLLTSAPIDAEYFLAERFARRVQADTEWFEKIISHQPTVGAFYEILLRNSLKELAPVGCELGTGFVLDPHRPVHSKQSD